MHRRHNRIAKLLLWIMALGWLLAPLHFIESEHRWCAEHDQFEHNDAAYGAAAQEFGSAPAASGPRLFFVRFIVDGSNEHEVCQVLGSLNRSKAALTLDAAQAIERPAADFSALSAAPDFHPIAPLLAVAPKQGPPA